MINLKTELRQIQPYFIEKELLSMLYFKENRKDVEYWIMFYCFIRGLSNEAIGVRLGYSKQYIGRLSNQILHRNKAIIEDFIDKHAKHKINCL